MPPQRRKPQGAQDDPQVAVSRQSAEKSSPDASEGASGDSRILSRTVIVDGRAYGPAHPQNEVTAEVAAKITNPNAWKDGP